MRERESNLDLSGLNIATIFSKQHRNASQKNPGFLGQSHERKDATFRKIFFLHKRHHRFCRHAQFNDRRQIIPS
jgi:hypothetical protein